MNDLNKLKNNVIPNRSTWENVIFTNCLAHALNIDVAFDEFDLYKEYLLNIYELGIICGCYSDYYTNSEVVRLLYKDCELLDIDIKKVDENYILKSKDEWLIGVYNSRVIYEDGYKASEYHFIKKEYNKTWLSKPGYGNITNTDYNDIIINNPKEAYFETSDDYDGFIPLKYLGIYRLRKKTK